MQKTLAERFGQLNAALGQDLFHLREIHRRSVINNLCNVFTAAASCRSLIVSGGVKLITFECSPSGRRMKPRRSRALINFSAGWVAGEPSRRHSSTPARRPSPRTLSARLEGRGSRVERMESKNLPSTAL